MGCSWLVHPLPLRERVGRGVAPASSTLRTRRLVVPSPSPGLRPPSPAGEGFSPFSPGRRCRAAADEGETPVLPTPHAPHPTPLSILRCSSTSQNLARPFRLLFRGRQDNRRTG